MWGKIGLIIPQTHGHSPWTPWIVLRTCTMFSLTPCSLQLLRVSSQSVSSELVQPGRWFSSSADARSGSVYGQRWEKKQAGKLWD